MITRRRIMLPKQPNRRPARSQIVYITSGVEHSASRTDVLVEQMQGVCNTISHHAEDLAMVASEGVFQRRLSASVSRSSRALLALGRELQALREEIVQAGPHSLGRDKQS